MKLFGFEVSRVRRQEKDYSVPSGSWWGSVRESFAGAWQRNIEVETRPNLLAFSAVYACVTLLADDVSKLYPMLMEEHPDHPGIWIEVDRTSPYEKVLSKPNAFQTYVQFFCQWMVSKLLYGNTYVLLERESLRGLVRAMYVLDPRKVIPIVADDGSVWYQISADVLVGAPKENIFSADDIIHDRCATLFHPLVGISPIYACGATATQGIRIQTNSERFFRNNSAPSGHLTAQGQISKPTAERLKEEFEKNFSGSNYGRMLVTGDGLKYEPFTIPAQDAQLIEQLRWTIEDVARCFRVPLHKIGAGTGPSFNNVAALNQDYYNQALQVHIEAIECLLYEGLGLANAKDRNYKVELDLEGLMRMDPAQRMEVASKGMQSGVLKPNEVRAKENLIPVEGGDTPYLQEQNWALSELAKRDIKSKFPDPGSAPPTGGPPALPPPKKDSEVIIEMAEVIGKGLKDRFAELTERIAA